MESEAKAVSSSGCIVGKGPWCGTPGGYSNHACRCPECREAWRLQHKKYMSENPDQRERHRLASARRNEALRELRRRLPEEYAKIAAEVGSKKAPGLLRKRFPAVFDDIWANS